MITLFLLILLLLRVFYILLLHSYASLKEMFFLNPETGNTVFAQKDFYMLVDLKLLYFVIVVSTNNKPCFLD